VLAYIAFALAPVTRAERVMQGLDYTQREFLGFVLDHYVQRGIGELDTDKLPHLIELKYNTVSDAIAELGPVKNIREVFTGFQRYLY